MATQQEVTTVRQQARADALATARHRLVCEQRAVTLCRQNGWGFDLRVAEINIRTLRQVITALESEEKK